MAVCTGLGRRVENSSGRDLNQVWRGQYDGEVNWVACLGKSERLIGQGSQCAVKNIYLFRETYACQGHRYPDFQVATYRNLHFILGSVDIRSLGKKWHVSINIVIQWIHLPTE